MAANENPDEVNADVERQVPGQFGFGSRFWQVSPDLLGVLKSDGHFERSNPAWQTLLGWSETEVRRMSIFELLHPEDRERTRDDFEHLKQGKPILRLENRYRRKDGGYNWFTWVAAPLGEAYYCSGRDITFEKAQAAELAARTMERDRVWQNSRDLLVIVNADGIFRAVNPAWTEVLGYRLEEVVGQSLLDFVWPEDTELTQGGLNAAVSKNDLTNFEIRCRHKDGTFRWISWHTSVDGGLVYANGRDISIRKAQAAALEHAGESLRQSQKMEAIGQLTGGIAHDFNNILTGIIGSLDIVRRRMASDRLDDVPRFLDAASHSAHRAAALTHRLLAFARRQSLDTKPSDVNRLVSAMEDMLRRTLGEHVELQTMLADGLWLALADANQFENAILNLAINARDAMPDGGRLTIETENTRLDADYARQNDDVEAGYYVAISVSDTGTGMPPDVVARAFDPFFTTKAIGLGTGLGLSMIYGFAKQSRGHLRIYSEVGKGTTVKLYLARATTDVISSLDVEDIETPRGHGETVLVVEDDATVRLLIASVLEELGYHHVEAADVTVAMAILRSKQRIDLLLTDVGLPIMNGRELAEFARESRPALKVLFVTGYAEKAAVRGGFVATGMDMLTKPFALDALGTKIREMIER
jgi:PAS domain S-box-containing protein